MGAEPWPNASNARKMLIGDWRRDTDSRVIHLSPKDLCHAVKKVQLKIIFSAQYLIEISLKSTIHFTLVFILPFPHIDFHKTPSGSTRKSDLKVLPQKLEDFQRHSAVSFL